MTVLHRAPREVYRVYDEDEFFACPDSFAETECHERRPSSRLGSGRTVRRLAGSAALVAAAGTLVGLVLLVGRSSQSRTWRPRAREIASDSDTGSSRGVGSRVSGLADRARVSLPTSGVKRHTTGKRLTRRSFAHARVAVRRATHGVIVRGANSAAPSPRVPAAPEPAPAYVPVSAQVAVARPQTSDPGQAEFGFEHGGSQ